MNNILLITKIYLKNTFSFIKKNKNEAIKEIMKNNSKTILLLVSFVYISYYVFQFSLMTIEGFIQLNIPNVLFAQFYLIASIFILMNNIFKAKENFFVFKDYDLIMSLPIKRSKVLLSKILTSYLFNLLYVVMFMLPCLIAGIIKINLSLPFIIIYIILALLLPIIPMVIANIIGVAIAYISNKFKLKNLINYIMFFLIMGISFYISFNITNNVEAIDIANISKSFVDRLNNIYPMIKIYLDALENMNIIAILLNILIPTASLYLFITILNNIYIKIRKILIKENVKKDYKISEYKENVPLKALYKKEIKYYFKSPNYVLNTAMGSLLLIIMSIGIHFLKEQKLIEIFEIPEIGNIIKTFAPYIICSFMSLTCSTHSAISLEGKKLWILRSLPVGELKILISKILVTLSISIPSIIIATISFAIKFNLDLKNIILCLLIPTLVSIFIAMLGIIINLMYPLLDYDNEIKVIKQSAAAFMTMMSSLIITGAIIGLVFTKPEQVSNIIIPLFIVLNIIGFAILKTYGVKKLKQL